MCGIAGFFDPLQRSDPARAIHQMTSALAHRGPDDAGWWIDPETQVALGHRRLAVRDLSPAGHQPMATCDDRLVLVFNGEIYNTEQLRRQLPDRLRLRGSSDTELLLQALAHWGIDRTLQQVAGMFAVAVYDRVNRRVTLIRDRLGIKPLYYASDGRRVLWASEPKALLAHPDFRPSLDPASLAQFLQFGFVPAPASMLQQTRKVRPGTYVTWDIADPSQCQETVYWSACEQARAGRAQPLEGSDDELATECEQLLRQIVREHMIADVPLGAFLSGGIDSSLIVALMQSLAGQSTRTFTIGFDDPSFDEAGAARQLAACFHTDHTEHYLSLAEIAQQLPRIPTLYCEPLADTSALPTLLVAEQARRQVTVALTGDGGDEVFAGYRHYWAVPAIDRRLRSCPVSLRRVARMLLGACPAALLDQLDPLQQWLAGRPVAGSTSESVRKLRALLAVASDRELYEGVRSISYATQDRSLLAPELAAEVFRSPGGPHWDTTQDLLTNMQLWDSLISLPDDILHKVDIASMAVGLEVRVPLLDHRLFQWAWRLPARCKTKDDSGKQILRRVLARHLPPAAIDRRKRGFSAPLDQWLRGPLRDWAEAHLATPRLQQLGLFNPRAVRRSWNALLQGKAGYARIWPVLVFLAWHDHYLAGPTPPSLPLSRNSSPSDHEHCLRHARRNPLSVGS